jgi:type II secretory pathway pseudopilin PulG
MRLQPRSRQRGYALVMVLGALVLISLVAARFAQRIDELRAQTITLQAQAQQRLAMGNAMAAALYMVTTQTLGPGGVGPAVGAPLLYADDRVYRFPDGGEVQVQDDRGLLPLNAADRAQWRMVLAAAGVGAADADGWIDTLQDYQDTDSLKRLNGAEAPEYAALGLLPPRNDWLISVRELSRMPHWRDKPAVVEAVERIGSTSRFLVYNPNTASIELLGMLLPGATAQQLELFDTLRQREPFTSAAAAQRATGLPMERDDFVFHLGRQLRLTASAQGATKALQYNLTLVPGGSEAPWLISEAHPVVHRTRDTPDRATPFPLADPKAAKP